MSDHGRVKVIRRVTMAGQGYKTSDHGRVKVIR